MALNFNRDPRSLSSTIVYDDTANRLQAEVLREIVDKISDKFVSDHYEETL